MNSPLPISLAVRIEHWPIAGSFTISRGAKTQAAVVVAELSDGHHRGRGECVPMRAMARPSMARRTITALADEIARGLDRSALQKAMRRAQPAMRSIVRSGICPPNAPANRARAGRPAATEAARHRYTISLAEPDVMANRLPKQRAALCSSQTRQRRRPGAHHGGATGGATGRADRRCQ